MKYRKRAETIIADQWFRNGDHPGDYAKDREIMENGHQVTKPGKFFEDREWEGGVVRYYRLPGSAQQTCPTCHQLFHDHGWIDSGGNGQTVCPADYVITNADGTYTVMKPDRFVELYTRDRG